MADVDLTVQKIVSTGLTPSFTGSLATANTYKVRNNGRVFVEVKKTAAVDCTVTVQTPKTVNGLAVAERTVTVAATTGDKMIGPFPPDTYNDGSGDVNITFSDVDGLTVAAFEL